MSDRALDSLVRLSDVVKLLIFHLLDHKSLKMKVEQKDLAYLSENFD